MPSSPRRTVRYLLLGCGFGLPRWNQFFQRFYYYHSEKHNCRITLDNIDQTHWVLASNIVSKNVSLYKKTIFGNVGTGLIFIQQFLEFLFISLFCYIYRIFSYHGIAIVLWINLLGMHASWCRPDSNNNFCNLCFPKSKQYLVTLLARLQSENVRYYTPIRTLPIAKQLNSSAINHSATFWIRGTTTASGSLFF